ncbi:MAG: two-component system nitrogen regulation sensor histidine kinase NtrY [Oceanicoccus sp.]|jgi:two-component system nitrogen regulation sensor histidine kinase NtrY
MNRRFFSFQGKIFFLNLALVAVTLLSASVAFNYLPFWWAFVAVLLALLPITFYCSAVFSSPIVNLINALSDSTNNIRDEDFSVTISSSRHDELGELVVRHNEIGQLLRAQRHSINQRELLLDSVLQSMPVAMWLCDNREYVVYANIEARTLLSDGKALTGVAMKDLLGRVNTSLADAIESEKDGLVSIETAGEVETFSTSCRIFNLNGRQHRLYLVRQMTREISRQEVHTWKRVIRVISHELNNSLAPISSLAHSGKISMAKMGEELGVHDSNWGRLELILKSIGERATHLTEFIAGYATFARLPTPRIRKFDLMEVLVNLSQQQAFELNNGKQKFDVHMDQAQLEQVLINLIKNAREATGEEGRVRVSVERKNDYVVIVVSDDGVGMSDEVLAQALLPFYSTKQEGTGLGLPLCREIVEAHGGQLSIRNGATNGVDVIIRIPQAKN